MTLAWSPQVRLAAGAYEAWVSPLAGGRLCRLVWHGHCTDRELVVPVDSTGTFDADAWPKQGAFPMLPYTNRLASGRFCWRGMQHRVRTVPGHDHGLHGMGHRQAWQILEEAKDRVSMGLHHRADRSEWPWSFSAQLTYQLSNRGLQVALALRNDSQVSMPVILGWHPYVPASWLDENESFGFGAQLHDLGSVGLDFPEVSGQTRPLRPVVADLRVPHTLALEGWRSGWSLGSRSVERWYLESDADHLVHHVPADRRYACVEPVTSLPGSLRSRPGSEDRIELKPGAQKNLNCSLRVIGQDR